MAKRRSASGGKTRATASDRPRAASSRRRSSGRAKQSSGVPSGGEPREQVVGGTGRGRSNRRGFLSNAGDIARNVGQTTLGAAQSGLGAARDAAGAVASRAQETATSVAGKVRENPWPSLLIGAGATWLAIDAVRGNSSDRPSRASGRGRGANERGGVGQAVSKVAEAGRAAGEQIEEFVRERPLLAGAATLGLGVAVGMAMPSSVTENEMLGQARDSVVRRARDVAKGTAQKMRDVTESFERMGPFGSGSSSGRGSSNR